MKSKPAFQQYTKQNHLTRLTLHLPFSCTNWINMKRALSAIFLTCYSLNSLRGLSLDDVNLCFSVHSDSSRSTTHSWRLKDQSVHSLQSWPISSISESCNISSPHKSAHFYPKSLCVCATSILRHGTQWYWSRKASLCGADMAQWSCSIA